MRFPRRISAGLVAVASGVALLVAVPDEGRGQSETLLETITVSADNSAPPQTSSTTLVAGETYKLVASGTFFVSTASGDYSHDAIYCYASTNPGLCSPPEQYGEKLAVGYADAGLNGFPAEFGSAPAYTDAHTYAVTFTASKTGRLRFAISNPDGNPASGSLTVEIREVGATGPGPTACPSQTKTDCAEPPYLFRVRHPQKSKARNKWDLAEVTFNLAPGDYADAPSPLMSPKQKRAILDIRGVDDKDIAAFADSRFRRFGRAACVAVAGQAATQLMKQLERELKEQPLLVGNIIRWRAGAQLETCLEMLDRALVAEAAKSAGSATAHSAARGCAPARVPIKTSRTGSKLFTKFLGKQPAAALRVTCKKIRGGQRVTIRPRKKGATLRSAVGKRLHVGLMRSAIAGTGNKDLTVRFSR